MILDAEVLMKAADGSVLAFGAQGVHEQKKHAGSHPCLQVFDCLWLDGQDQTQLPLRRRRAALEAAICPQPTVELSSCKHMRTAGELRKAFVEAESGGLEGLMIKDVESKYVPADRKLWLKLKKDYLSDAECASAGCSMADSADLVVLGGLGGSGAKAGLISSFLMGGACTATPNR